MFDCHGFFKGKNTMIVKKNSSLNTIFIYMYLSKALLNCLVIEGITVLQAGFNIFL